jgi:hypothetical protein
MSDRPTLVHAIEDAGIERAKADRFASAIVDLIHDEVEHSTRRAGSTMASPTSNQPRTFAPESNY